MDTRTTGGRGAGEGDRKGAAPAGGGGLRRRQVLGLLGGPGLWGVSGLAWGQNLGQKRPEKARVVLAVGAREVLAQLPLTLADELGYFEAEGLQVELQGHADDLSAQQALFQGGADVAAGHLAYGLLLRQMGQACVAFALLSRTPQMVLGVSTAAMPDYRQLAQLKGRRLGLGAQGWVVQDFASQVLGRAGLRWQDVGTVPLGPGLEQLAAVHEGRVDALLSVDPVLSNRLEVRGEMRVLADTRSLRGTVDVYGGPMPGNALYAAHDFVQRHPRLVQALVNAVVRALKWLQTAAPGDIVRLVPQAYMLDERSNYLAALQRVRESLSTDGLIADEAVQTVLRRLGRPTGPGDANGANGANGAGAMNGGPAIRLPMAGVPAFSNDFTRRALSRY